MENKATKHPAPQELTEKEASMVTGGVEVIVDGNSGFIALDVQEHPGWNDTESFAVCARCHARYTVTPSIQKLMLDNGITLCESCTNQKND